jgi:hypothetical protein
LYLDCAIFFTTIETTPAPEERDIEELFEEDHFAGEDQGQSEPTGKPPLALAYLIPYFYAYALITKIHFYSCGGVACGTPALLRSIPPQWVLPLE